MSAQLESPTELSDSKPFASWIDGKRPAGYFGSPLGTAEKQFFDDNGFLVLDRALADDEVDAINAEATRICRNEGGAIEGSASAPAELSDIEVLQEILCIHFPHKLSLKMRDMLSHPAIVQALTTVVAPDVKCMQSMLFLKAAGKPGQAWHQDEDYIPTRDRSLIGAWIALDDATVENGCLWVIPSSHKPGVLWKQEWHGDKSFDCSFESRGFPYTTADEVPVEVKRGSIVFFNGYTLHRSLPNRAKSGFRRALVNHYMSASSPLPWRVVEKQSVAMMDYRDIVMVAGTDPYAWKGIEDLARPHIRPSGQGGCVNWVNQKKLEYAD